MASTPFPVTPANGTTHDPGNGVTYTYDSSITAWKLPSAAGATPNATQAVAGTVEIATAAEIQAATTVGGSGANLVVRPDKLFGVGLMSAATLDSAVDKVLINDQSTGETLKIKVDDLIPTTTSVNPLSAGQTMSDWYIRLGIGDTVLPAGPAGVPGYWEYIKSDRGDSGTSGQVSINFIPIEEDITLSYRPKAGVGAYAAGTSIQIPATTSPPNEDTFVYFVWRAT